MNKQDLLEWVRMNKGKIIALVISCIYLALAFFSGYRGDWAKILLFLILPLACIFFSEAMGGYEGPTGLARPWITRTTPGCFVALAGWALLLFPLIFAVLSAIFNPH